MIDLPDLEKRCSNKHNYWEAGMNFWCCRPHCKEEVDAVNSGKNRKISKKDQKD